MGSSVSDDAVSVLSQEDQRTNNLNTISQWITTGMDPVEKRRRTDDLLDNSKREHLEEKSRSLVQARQQQTGLHLLELVQKYQAAETVFARRIVGVLLKSNARALGWSTAEIAACLGEVDQVDANDKPITLSDSETELGNGSTDE